MIAVAIDGPAGAGKSTIAKLLAKEFGYVYVDTGALYRAIGLFAAEHGIDPADGGALVPMLPGIRLELLYRDGEQRILLSGRDVSEAIRAPEMGMAASKVSAIPAVRAFLLDTQRDMAKSKSIIMDGRDIGTVVLRDADVKIFLTASAESRAERRYLEHLAKGEDVSYNKILEDIRRRDYNDSHRAASPLRQADDAVLADTTGFTLEEAVALMKRIVEERIR